MSLELKLKGVQMGRSIVKILTRVALLGILLSLTGIVSAVAQDSPSIKEVVEKEMATQKIMDETLDRLSSDPLNRTTPRSTITGIAKLLQVGDYEKAVKYFDMRYLPESIKPEDFPRIVRQTQYIFNRNITN